MYLAGTSKTTTLQTAALNYKLIKKIKDDRFDEDKIHQYDLLVNIGTRDLQVGVLDTLDKKMLLLEDYVFPALSSHEQLIQVLRQLFDEHAVLQAAFWNSIRVSIKNSKFVQVPKALFVEEAAHEYLKYNARIDADEEVLKVDNPAAKAVTVFALHRDIKTWIVNVYPNREIIFEHQSAALIEGVMDFAKNRKDEFLYIYVDRFKLHILACRDGKLLYYNQFIIRQFSDYVKYIMLVLKSLGMNQESSQVMLWGYIGKNSPHYHEFYKYISNVVFGERPSVVSFGYLFDEVQEHHFFDLYSMYLIGQK